MANGYSVLHKPLQTWKITMKMSFGKKLIYDKGFRVKNFFIVIFESLILCDHIPRFIFLTHSFPMHLSSTP